MMLMVRLAGLRLRHVGLRGVQQTDDQVRVLAEYLLESQVGFRVQILSHNRCRCELMPQSYEDFCKRQTVSTEKLLVFFAASGIFQEKR